MAITKFLNSDHTVWATTYWGGTKYGRCIDISMQVGDDLQVTRTFTEEQLQSILEDGGPMRGLAVPSADDEPVMYKMLGQEGEEVVEGEEVAKEDPFFEITMRDYKIREMFTKGQCTRKELADIYGLTYQQVYAITGPNKKKGKK